MSAVREITVLILALLSGLLLPGHAFLSMLQLPSERRLLDRLIRGMGLSLAMLPLLLLLSTQIGLVVNRSVVVALLVVAGSISLWQIRQGSKRPGGGYSTLGTLKGYGLYSSDAVLVLLFLVSLAVRLLTIQGVVAAPGSDGYHHSLIAKLIVERGGVPASYEPYAPLASFTYHFGFHALVATFHWLTGIEVVQLVVILGQVLNSLVVLTTYLLANRLTGDRGIALFGAFGVGLLSVFPAFYVNWGRLTQLMGLAILPVALTLSIDLIEGKHTQGHLLAASVALGGLFLSHYRILIMYFSFIFLYVVWESYARRGQPRTLAWMWIRMLTVVVLAGLLTLPWALNLLGNLRLHGLVAEHASKGFFSIVGRVGSHVLLRKPNVIFAILAGAGAVLGLHRRNRGVITVCLWGALLLLISNPYWLDLPGVGMLDSASVVMSLFLPASVAAGYCLAGIWRWGRDGPAIIRIALTIAMCLLGIFGAVDGSRILDPWHAYVREADLTAMSWIKRNVPPSATFLVNPFSWDWDPEFITGSDAGWWLPLLAERHTLIPPMTYTLEQPLEPDYASRVAQVAKAAARPTMPSALELLHRNGVTHVYIGERGGVIDPVLLMDSPNYELIYHEGDVWVFSIHYEGSL